jgi:IS1 family transposase
MMVDLNISTIELDEIWAFIRTKQRRAQPLSTDGDWYSFLAMSLSERAIISYRTGKRNESTARDFVLDLRERVLGDTQITSDAYIPFLLTIRRIFYGSDYARIKKSFQTNRGNQAQHRYSPGRIRGIETESVMGDPKNPSTSHSERLNLSVRTSSRRFARLSLGHSKKLRNHRAAVDLFVCHYNLCRVHSTIRETPAMALGITDHPWSVRELVEEALRADPMPTPHLPQRRLIDSATARPQLRVIQGGKS